MPQNPYLETLTGPKPDNPYLDTLRGDQTQQDTALKVSTKQATETSPDRQAEVLRLSRSTGLPASLIERNFDAIQKRESVRTLPERLKAYPFLSRWATNPENLSVIQDDVEQLGLVERLMNYPRALLSGVPRVVSGVLGLAETAMRLPGFPVEGTAGMDIDYEALVRDPQGPGAPLNRAVTEVLEERRQMTTSAANYIRGTQRGVGRFERGALSGVESIGMVLSMAPLGPAGVLGGMGASTAGESATRATEQGLHPAVALAFGSVDGAVEVATELLPVSLLFKQFGGAPFLRTLAQELGTEILGEQVATLLQDLNAWAVLPENEKKTFRDYLGERPSAAVDTLVATIVGTVGQAGIARAASRAFSGKTPEEALLEDVGNAVQQSKTFERMPEKVRELVQQMSEGGVESVGLPLDTFQQYFQDKNLNPREEARKILGDTEAYDQAVATGEDLAVPFADYVTKIAPSEHSAFFVKEARFSPEAMNAREQEEFLKASTEEVDSSVDSRQDSAAKVREDVIGQLTGLGYDRKTVEAYAATWEALFGTLVGKRAGLDPVAFFQKYNAKITRPLPEILRSLPNTDVALTGLMDRLRAGQVPSQQEMFGTSLVEFLRQKGGVLDEGGELAALEADAENRPFTKNLVQAEGLPLDTAREAAAEAGYLPMESSIADLLDLIEKEVRGEPVFSPAQARPEAIEQSLQLEQLAAYLQSRDVDVQTATNEDIRQLLQGAVAEEGAEGPVFEHRAESGSRARIRLGKHGISIELLQRADLSSFLHESGHFFLEVFGDVVEELRTQPGELTDLQKRVAADYDAMLKHLGAESRETLTREQHEEFARTFEAYLREGKAPSPALRPVFARFRAWLVALYRSLTQLKVRLTPEVTGILDRLIATDQEILQAEQEAGILAMIETQGMAERLGLSPEELALYRKDVQKASDQRRDELQGQYLEEYRRTQADWYQKRAEDVRKEVAAEVHGQRDYIALSFLQKGTLPDGSPLPEGVQAAKLDVNALEERYGKYKDSSIVQALRKLNVYRREGGMHPDIAARLFGYSSGDELVQALLNARDMNAFIEAETRDRMRTEYGDMLTDGTAPEKAKAAVMTVGRSEVIATEMKALARKVRQMRPFVEFGKRQERQAQAEAQRQGIDTFERFIPSIKAVRSWAESRVRATRVRDLRPGTYWVAARNASRQATEFALADQYDKALSAKQRELVSVEMYRAATEALTAVNKTVDLMRSFDEKRVRERIGKAGEDYLDQIDALRERYDFARLTNKQADRRARLGDWISRQEAQGLPVDIPDSLRDETGRRPWRTVPVEELYGLRDAVEHIAHLARLKNKLLKAQQKRELDAVVDEAVASIDGNAKGPRSRQFEIRLPSDQAARSVSGWFASHRKLNSFLRQMDGWKDGGTMWESVMRPINEAQDAEASRNAEASKAVVELFMRHYSKEQGALYQKSYIPEIEGSLSKMGRLMVALNWGNEGNKQRVLAGGLGQSGTLNESQVAAILNTLDERDWQFVEDVWTYIDSYWDEIALKQKRVAGVAPEKVEAIPFINKFGRTMRGGYFPIKYEGQISARAGSNLEADFAESIKQASYTQASTRRGHTKERLANVKQPIRLDFGVITEHLQQVIHDLTHHETLIDVGRLLSHRQVQDAIVGHYGTVVYDQVKAAIRDVAWGTQPSPQWTRMLDYLRRGVVTANLALNLTTSAIQPLGLVNGAIRVGPKYFAKGMLRWARNAGSMESSVQWIHERSDFMRTRGLTQFRELNEMRNKIGMDRGRVSGWMFEMFSKLGVDASRMPVLADSYFYLIQKAQQIADVPTWLGEYEKAMADPQNDEDRAVALADQAVIDSQGSGRIADLAQVERGGPLAKILTTFYTYPNVVFNQTFEAVKARKWIDAAVLLAILPALEFALREALGGSDDDDWDTMLEKLGRHELAGLFGMMAGFRELSGIIQGYGYQGPSGLRYIAVTGKAATQALQGELDPAFWRALNEAGGIFLQYPAKQIERTVEGMGALVEGESKNPLVLVTGPPRE